jgi:CRISPR-associated protein Cmr5
MKTRDQQLAATIFEQTQEIKDKDKAEQKKYGSRSHQLPVLVRTAGLAQALAFVDARGNDMDKLLLDHLATTVGHANRAALLTASRKAPLDEYMLLTQQVLAALLWYKRFAQSVLDIKPGAEPHDTEGAS